MSNPEQQRTLPRRGLADARLARASPRTESAGEEIAEAESRGAAISKAGSSRAGSAAESRGLVEADLLNHRQRRSRYRDEPCPMCGSSGDYLWTCPCGFSICDRCMKADLWGFTCNNITWVCPDCGEVRSY